MKTDWSMEDISFDIVDILHFTRKPVSYRTEKRDFAVFSLRLLGHTTFVTDTDSVTVSSGDLLYIPPGTSYLQHSKEEELICLHLGNLPPLFDRMSVFSLLRPEIKNHFMSLSSLWQKKEPFYLLRCKKIIYGLLYELLSAPSGDTSSLHLIAPSVSYMQQHFTEANFSLSYAISLSFVSPAYFRRLFRSAYHMTPIDYMQRLKVDHAKALLEGRSLSLSEISEACGFSDEKYFYAVFKKITGYTPSKWRGRPITAAIKKPIL